MVNLENQHSYIYILFLGENISLIIKSFQGATYNFGNAGSAYTVSYSNIANSMCISASPAGLYTEAVLELLPLLTAQHMNLRTK